MDSKERKLQEKTPIEHMVLHEALSEVRISERQSIKPEEMILPSCCNLPATKEIDITDIKARLFQATATTGTTTNPAGIDIETASSSSSRAESSSRTSHEPNVFPEGLRTDAYWGFRKVTPDDYKNPSLVGVPIETQEVIILEELIYVLTGVRGSYIEPIEENIGDSKDPGIDRYCTEFNISPKLNTTLRDLVKMVLPLASHHNGIQKFIQEIQADGVGQVLQALGSALTELTTDFYTLLSQVETELMEHDLTIQKLIFYLNPTMHNMSDIVSTVAEIGMGKLRGGAALTLLFNRINYLTSDIQSEHLLTFLIESAAVPYMEMLDLWIQKGVIVDPSQEFFVVDNNEVVKNEQLTDNYSTIYWEKRYSLRSSQIPCFLSAVADKILRTGKYLNVIKQCGKNVTPPVKSLKFIYDTNNHSYLKTIEEAYRFAAKTLLNVLQQDNDLLGHLMSVKRYFLLSQGDFIVQFMDACEEQLSKNVDQVLPMTLENLLGLTLRFSMARSDPYKDDLHCELLPYDLATQMSRIMSNCMDYRHTSEHLDFNCFQCFAFRLEVRWPISLVLNHIALSKYQILFRQLFYCKYVERELYQIWKINRYTKRGSKVPIELPLAAFALRQRMINAILELQYYMTVVIITPNWHNLTVKIPSIDNVDDLINLHQDFLDVCLTNCMISETVDLQHSIFHLGKICLKFCQLVQSMTAGDHSTVKIVEIIKNMALEFNTVLLKFLTQLGGMANNNSNTCFINLVQRLNFNCFYTKQIQQFTGN